MTEPTQNPMPDWKRVLIRGSVLTVVLFVMASCNMILEAAAR